MVCLLFLHFLFLFLSLLQEVTPERDSLCSHPIFNRFDKLTQKVNRAFPIFAARFKPLSLFPFDPSFSLPWDLLFDSILSESHVTNIVFFGGSMVMGTGCKQGPLELTQCSYPSRVGNMLHYLFNPSQVDPAFPPYSPLRNASNIARISHLSVTNMGRGGIDTVSFLPTISTILRRMDPPPSALFFDFSVNDSNNVSIDIVYIIPRLF